MSNLFKSGFHNLSASEPYIIDMNQREIKENQNVKIVRPMEEQFPDDFAEKNESNKELLNDALEKATIIVDDAKEQADKIISDAEIEAGAIREQAREEGYQKGLAEGLEAAKQQVEDQVQAMRQQNAIAAKKKEEELLDELAFAEKDMVDVACGLIEKLTGILVDTYKPVMLHMINNALNNTDSSKQFIIRVASEIYPYIYDNRDRIIGAANPGVSIEIFGDAKLSSGQCMIESENGIVDLSMDVQVKNLITAIKLLSE